MVAAALQPFPIMVIYLEKERGRILIKPSDGRKNLPSAWAQLGYHCSWFGFHEGRMRTRWI